MNERKVDGWISDLVGALCDPIVVMPGGWGEDIPEWLRTKITMERLCENMLAIKEGREPTATEAEAAWYLSSASLTGPLSHDWTQIYLYVATGLLKKEAGKEIPNDIKVESLTEYQWRELKHLKNWIYEQRVKHRKEKERGIRREERQAQEQTKEESKVIQGSFF